MKYILVITAGLLLASCGEAPEDGDTAPATPPPAAKKESKKETPEAKLSAKEKMLKELGVKDGMTIEEYERRMSH